MYRSQAQGPETVHETPPRPSHQDQFDSFSLCFQIIDEWLTLSNPACKDEPCPELRLESEFEQTPCWLTWLKCERVQLDSGEIM